MENFIIKDLGQPHDSDVYHYTKLENLFKIITDKGLVFHASRFDVMNDPEDSVFMSLIINHKNIQNGAFELFGDFWSDEALPCLTSFSCSQDNKIMWRLYDAEVMLHIDTNIIYNYCLEKGCKHTRMGKVEYSEEVIKGSEADKKLTEFQSLVMNEKAIFGAFVPLTLYKHPDFEIENEWRLMCFDKDEICSEIKSKGIRYNTLWLYREIYLPKECLTGITLRVYDNKTLDALLFQINLMLEQYGYPIGLNEIHITQTAEVRK